MSEHDDALWQYRIEAPARCPGSWALPGAVRKSYASLFVTRLKRTVQIRAAFEDLARFPQTLKNSNTQQHLQDHEIDQRMSPGGIANTVIEHFLVCTRAFARSRAVPGETQVEGFLAAYKSVVLAEEGRSILQKMYDRAGQTQVSVLEYHLGYILSVIIPTVADGLSELELSIEEAHILLRLFTPISAGRSKDRKYDQKSRDANRFVLEHLHSILKKNARLQELLASDGWTENSRPLVNHLARELLVWAYVFERNAMDPQEIQHRVEGLLSPPNAVDNLESESGWTQTLSNMLTRINSDLIARPNDTVEYEERMNLSRVVPIPEPSDPLSGVEQILKNFVITSLKWQQAEKRGPRPWPHRNSFDKKLLLRFAYTACTHRHFTDDRVQREPGTKFDIHRKKIVAFLQERGFRLENDDDLDNHLDWLNGIKDANEPLGDDFRIALRAVTEKFAPIHLRAAKWRLRTYLLKALNWIVESYPDHETSRHWSSLTGDDQDRLRDRELLETISDGRADLYDALTPGIHRVLADNSQINSQEELAERLEELECRIPEYCNSRTYSTEDAAALAKWIRKYYTLLRRPGSGTSSQYAAKSDQWVDWTNKLCTSGTEGIIQRYRKVWNRIGQEDLPLPASPIQKLRPKLAELGPVLAHTANFEAP